MARFVCLFVLSFIFFLSLSPFFGWPLNIIWGCVGGSSLPYAYLFLPSEFQISIMRFRGHPHGNGCLQGLRKLELTPLLCHRDATGVFPCSPEDRDLCCEGSIGSSSRRVLTGPAVLSAVKYRNHSTPALAFLSCLSLALCIQFRSKYFTFLTTESHGF